MKTLINQPNKKNWNMKKIILLFAGLAFLTFKNQAQTTVYHPFPDSSATWNIYFSLYCFSDGTAEEYYPTGNSRSRGDPAVHSRTSSCKVHLEGVYE